MLVRLLDTTSRANSALKQNLPRRAKVGHPPGSSRAPYVAVPPMYSSGEYHSLKAQGLASWERFGPWGPRRLASLHYAKSCGFLSPSWGWVAAPLFMHAPDSLMRSSPPEADLCAHAPASEAPPPLPPVNPNTGIETPRGDTPAPSAPFPSPADSAPVHLHKGMDTIPPEDGNAQPAQLPYDSARWPRIYREGYGWEAHPPPKDAQETKPRDKSKKVATSDTNSTPYSWRTSK